MINYGRKKPKASILLSILFHLLLLIIILLHPFLLPLLEKEKKPFLYTPSYLYHSGSIQPSSSSTLTVAKQSIHSTFSPSIKPTIKKAIATREHPIKRQSILLATDQFLQNYRYQQLAAAVKYEEPIYLIGDHQQSPNPLIKLLAYALSANFFYPDSAGKFGITGRAIIGMTLHPDGHLSDIQLLKSTGNLNLDNAALYAVNQAPRVKRVNQYLSTAKHFVIGFVFRTSHNY